MASANPVNTSPKAASKAAPKGLPTEIPADLQDGQSVEILQDGQHVRVTKTFNGSYRTDVLARA